MYQSLHIHTPRCKHAVGTEREYTLRAIEAGLTDIGFSDHSPLFDGLMPHVGDVRMDMAQLEEYVSSLRALREEFKDSIRIRIGLELEYIPHMHARLMERFKAAGVEYFALGQHFIRGGEYMTLDPTQRDDYLTEYVDTVLEGARTGNFAFVAHPDLVNYTADEQLYRSEMLRLCKGLKEADIPLEINLHGLWDDRNYPNGIFWDIVSQVGNRVIMNSDAHQTFEVWDEGIYNKGLRYAKAHGVTVLKSIL